MYKVDGVRPSESSVVVDMPEWYESPVAAPEPHQPSAAAFERWARLVPVLGRRSFRPGRAEYLAALGPVQGPVLPPVEWTSDVGANPAWEDRSPQIRRLLSMRHTQTAGALATPVKVYRTVVSAQATPSGVVCETAVREVEVVAAPLAVCVLCGTKGNPERGTEVCPSCRQEKGRCALSCEGDTPAWACFRCVPELDPFWAGVKAHQERFRRTQAGSTWDVPWEDKAGRPDRNVIDTLVALPNPSPRSTWSLALSNPAQRGWHRVINSGAHVVAAVWSERRGQWAVVVGYYAGHSYPRGSRKYGSEEDKGLPVQSWQNHPLPFYVAEAFVWVGSAAADLARRDMARAEIVDDVPDWDGAEVPDPDGTWECLKRTWRDSQGRVKSSYVGFSHLFAEEAESLARHIAGDWAEQVEVDGDEDGADLVTGWQEFAGESEVERARTPVWQCPVCRRWGHDIRGCERHAGAEEEG